MEISVLEQRICKMIAINYAVPEVEVRNVYDKINSIDLLLQSIKNSIINHTTLEFEIKQTQRK